MQESRFPIAVFDSGLGGMAVLQACRAMYPMESWVYFGDTAHLPYGALSKECIKQHLLRGAEFLLQEPKKLFVLACNTAAICAKELVQEHFSLPMIEAFSPTVHEAAQRSQSGKIALFATEATVRSNVYEKALKEKRADCQLFSIACPNFVSFLESEDFFSLEKELFLASRQLKDLGVDTLILACTHYALLRDRIEQKLAQNLETKNINIVCSATACARQVCDYLSQRNLLADEKFQEDQFFVSKNPEAFSARLERYFSQNLGLKNLHVQKASFHYNPF